uniref:Transmembrane protein n=1 Tax=Heterorhabditis bacteriophora TaxID=37862 RepID=A0A1I7WXD8_HETBA
MLIKCKTQYEQLKYIDISLLRCNARIIILTLINLNMMFLSIPFCSYLIEICEYKNNQLQIIVYQLSKVENISKHHTNNWQFILHLLTKE